MEKGERRALQLLLVFFLALCSIFASHLLSSGPYVADDVGGVAQSKVSAETNSKKEAPLPCSAPANNSICCDRSHYRTDVCVIRGDVRTSSLTSSILLYNSSVPPQKIRPYTRKWETSVMNTIEELTLASSNDAEKTRCDVNHSVPAVVFSTGGYTGNVYHEFNDGIIPLFITSRRFNRRVVFLIVNYRHWWISKYRDILPALSDYPPIDFSNDNRTHCFPEITVGLRIHGELSIDPTLTWPLNQTLLDFHSFLDSAFSPHIRYLENHQPPKSTTDAPKLVIIFRNGSRAVENEEEVVRLCENLGFQVQVMRLNYGSELSEIYRDLNASDALLGVVGCALTHLLFMKPGDVFIQIVPLGTDWGANANFAGPAMEFGLKYFPYKIKVSESSLARIYGKDDPVLTDPEKVNSKGWAETKRIYLGNQTVRIDIDRFVEPLTAAFQFIVRRKKSKLGTKFVS
ncbi:xylan glycosyltransferase MUCI21-like [Wolffia australiana]